MKKAGVLLIIFFSFGLATGAWANDCKKIFESLSQFKASGNLIGVDIECINLETLDSIYFIGAQVTKEQRDYLISQGISGFATDRASPVIADLRGTAPGELNFTKPDYRNTDLRNTDLKSMDLEGANMAGARVTKEQEEYLLSQGYHGFYIPSLIENYRLRRE